MLKKFSFLFFALALVIMAMSTAYLSEIEESILKGIVQRVDEVAIGEEGFIEAMFIVDIKITSKSLKGEVIQVEHRIAGSDSFPMYLKEKDRVLIGRYINFDGQAEYYVEDYQREVSFYWLLALFILVILVVGKGQGLKAILSLALTLGAIWWIHIPLMLKGFSPILTTVVVALIATTGTLLILGGWSRKSFAAIIGTISGVVIAAFIAYWVGSKAHLTGLSNEEAVMLKFIPQGDIFNPRELLFSGILLGTLGAVMDVAMSIASSIAEIFKHSPEISRRKLFASGMTIGRDVMGTMTNTLILAYLGSSLPLVLLFVANDMPMVRVMNFDIIVTELVRSLSGSIGIVLSLPITAALTVVLYKSSKK